MLDFPFSEEPLLIFTQTARYVARVRTREFRGFYHRGNWDSCTACPSHCVRDLDKTVKTVLSGYTTPARFWVDVPGSSIFNVTARVFQEQQRSYFPRDAPFPHICGGTPIIAFMERNGSKDDSMRSEP